VKTTLADVLVTGGCITLVTVLSGCVVWLIPKHEAFSLVIDVLVFLLAYGLLTMLLLAAIRRIRPYPVGEFATDSSAFTYWKLNAVLVDLAVKALAPFRTVFTEPLLHSGLGATVGAQVAIAGVLRDHPLIEIADGATIGQNSVITAHAITGAVIVVQPVRIGRGAVVGINCVVMPGVELGDHAVLAPGAVATVGTRIAPHELWGGIPARRLKAGSEPTTA
jgi:acetyltransferase-like isoleucine patch superfamily enzyme